MRGWPNERARDGEEDGETAPAGVQTSRVRCRQGQRCQREVDGRGTPVPRSLQGFHFLLRLGGGGGGERKATFCFSK